ncbi:MAG TPA: BMP family ABC transporter substrate-binding protein [Actinomycetes bacterium]
MRRVTTLATALLAGALVLTSCGGDGDDDATTTPKGDDTSSAAAEIKVGMAYDIGGRGDQSFNDAAALGLDKAKAELGVETQEAEAKAGEPESAKEERLRILAEQGYDPVLAIGFAYAAALSTVAAEFPDTTFGIVDDGTEGDNITNLLFAEEQGSFLVGAAAGLKTQTGTVGFIGGCTVDLIKKFEAGFKAGVEAAKPGTEILSKYLSDPPGCEAFTTTDTGKTAGEGMYDQGADIVYHAAGASGIGLFEAAAAADKLAIGVDQDQYNSADPAVKDVIMTSMLKRVDVAVFEFLNSVVDGTVKPGPVIFDLEADGVGYATSGGQVDDIQDQLEDYKQQIIDGEITVPTK